MNFDLVKSDFISYLEQTEVIEPGQYDFSSNNISVFMHAAEFREFLTTQYSYDADLSTKTIDEIMSLEIVDGKLVDPTAPENQTAQMLTAIQEEQTAALLELEAEQSDGTDGTEMPEEGEETSGEIPDSMTMQYSETTGVKVENPELATAIINDLLNDETFKSTIDRDGDGKIGEEDLAAFLNTIKAYDSDKSNITLEDIFGAIDDINEGTFRFLTDEEILAEVGELSDPLSTELGGSSSPVYSNGSFGGSFSTQPLPKFDAQGNPILENFSKDELDKALADAQGRLKGKKEELEGIKNGSDEEWQTKEGELNDAFDEFLDGLEEDQQQALKDQKELIDKKEDEITAKDFEIAEAEVAFMTASETLSSIEAKIEALTTQQGVLEQAQQEKPDDADIPGRITEIKAEIERLQQEKTEAETAKTQAETALETKKTERDTLANTDLAALQSQMDTLVEALPEDKQQAYADYKTKQDELKKYKEERVIALQGEITKEQELINKIQTEIKARETKSEINEKYPAYNAQALLEYAYQFLGYSEGQMESAMGYGFPDGLWCAAWVNAMLTKTYGKENLPSWYTNSNVNSCGSVLSAARQNGAVVDKSEARPGDLIIFRTNRGDAGHIGIVTKVENGVVYTIEGNTSSKVGERSYDLSSSRVNSIVRVTD